MTALGGLGERWPIQGMHRDYDNANDEMLKAVEIAGRQWFNEEAISMLQNTYLNQSEPQNNAGNLLKMLVCIKCFEGDHEGRLRVGEFLQGLLNTELKKECFKLAILNNPEIALELFDDIEQWNWQSLEEIENILRLISEIHGSEHLLSEYGENSLENPLIVLVRELNELYIAKQQSNLSSLDLSSAFVER